MSFSEATQKKTKKLLIITSSGGGGLLQAANAKEQEARANDPDLQIVRRDVLRDWIWEFMGQIFIDCWNGSQKRGNVAFQSFCVWGQLLVDRLFWPNFFFSALYTFFKEEVDEIIDTQNMGTSAILTALRIYNKKAKKKVQLKKVLVDLPTKKATHFFWPIKALSKKNRQLIKLVTVTPLLEDGQTPEEFWHENCRLTMNEIQYEDVYVRQAFLKYKNKPKTTDPILIKLKTKSEEELRLSAKCFEKGCAKALYSNNEIAFMIGPEDKVATVMLGSQPASEATFNYVKKFCQVAKESSGSKSYLFIFCSDHKPGEMSLFRKVVDYVTRIKGHSPHFSVIPFSFQTDEEIAPLFYRSDVTCTRSGGQTAMELMCVANGAIWVHSEAKKENGELTNEELLKGIPGWEAANALYLQKVRGAKVVTPDTIGPVLRGVIGSNKSRAVSNPRFARQRKSNA